MNLIKVFSFLTFLAIMSCQTPTKTEDSKHYILHVNLENAPFDSLYLRDYTDGKNILMAGEKTGEFTWEISLPDSIVRNYETMELVVTPYDASSNSSRSVRFITEKGGKNIIVANVGVEDETSYIKGTYIGETIIPNEYLLTKEDLEIFGDLFIEDFKLVIQNDQDDITVRGEDPYFSWFNDFDGEGITYDSFLASYTEIAKKYPNSRFLMTSLATFLTRYKSKEDVKIIYDILSDKHKDTKWTTIIDQFLSWESEKFENTSLPTLNNDKEEDIVQDTSKYNLIIFSASWCPPCIEEIPLLKEIHKDLNKDLIFTYVSTDNEKTVASFQKLVEKNEIPWRTLYAYQDVRRVENKYLVKAVPHTILVHPNGNMEVMDARNDEDRAKLYSLF